MFGETLCGKLPKEVNEATWYRIDCSEKMAVNTV